MSISNISHDSTPFSSSWSGRNLNPSNLKQLFASVPAVLLVAASAGFGCIYAWQTGSTFGPLLGALSVAMALGLELSKGFAVSRAIKCFGHWECGTGLALGLLALVAVAFSLQSELSLMATSKGDLAAHREATGRSLTVAQQQIEDARRELAQIEAEPAPSMNLDTVEEYEKAIEQMKLDSRWQRTNGCVDATKTDSIQFCKIVVGVESGQSRVRRLTELRTMIAHAQGTLSSGQIVEVADPGASALATYLEALGLVQHVDPALVAKWTLLIGVFALEAGSSLAVVLAGAMMGGEGYTKPGAAPVARTPETAAVSHVGERESGWRTTGQTTPADIPPKPAPVRSETVIRNRVPPLAHEGLSDRASLVLASLAGDSGCATNRRAWATKLGMSATTLGRALSELEAAGLVKVHADRNRGTAVRRLEPEVSAALTRH